MDPQDPQLSEDTNLAELEKEREKERRQPRWWHWLVPVSAEDFRSYVRLLRFIGPYRWKILLSCLLAAVAAGFLGAQFLILDDALGRLFGVIPGEKHACPTCQEELWIESRDSQSKLDKKVPFLNKGLGAVQGGNEAAPQEPPEDKAKFEVRAFDPEMHARHAGAAEVAPGKFRGLYVISGLFVLAVCLEAACKYWQAMLMAHASRGVVADLRCHVFQHIMGLSIRFHHKNHSAQLVSRITFDLNIFGNFLTSDVVRIVRELFTFIGLLAVILSKSGAFIFVVGGIVAIGLAPIQITAKNLRKKNKQSQAGMSEIYTYLTEALTGYRVVKAFGGEDREYQKFARANDDYMEKVIKIRRIRSLSEALVPIIAALGIAAILIIGGRRVLLGTMTMATFTIVVIMLGRMMTAMRNISKQLNDFHQGMAASDRISTLLSVRSDVREKEDAIELPPFQGEIVYEHVNFSHDPSSPTLFDVNLRVKKGEKVALVGPSGAGKSTIIDLLPRFYDPDSGRILVDGIDVRDVTFKSLRNQIGIVTQETLLFRDSVSDNIAYGKPDAEAREIRAAARASNALDFVRNLPERFNTLLGEKGHRLSGGERQRIAIARALLHNPPILILDEATSALDSESEIIVQKALQRLMANRTVIVIAHRLSTVRNADRIVVLDQGRIVEEGTHDELMGRHGLYERLYSMQMLGLRDVAGSVSQNPGVPEGNGLPAPSAGEAADRPG